MVKIIKKIFAVLLFPLALVLMLIYEFCNLIYHIYGFLEDLSFKKDSSRKKGIWYYIIPNWFVIIVCIVGLYPSKCLWDEVFYSFPQFIELLKTPAWIPGQLLFLYVLSTLIRIALSIICFILQIITLLLSLPLFICLNEPFEWCINTISGYEPVEDERTKTERKLSNELAKELLK